jgi:hypothetical protein
MRRTSPAPDRSMPSASRMNVSMPAEIRHLVTQGAISTAALERRSLDDSSWILRAVCEKLVREWDSLSLGQPVPDAVRRLAERGLARTTQENAGHIDGLLGSALTARDEEVCTSVG